MHVTASIKNSADSHEARIATEGVERSLPIPPRSGGPGSSASGGELLMLALATCYGNDLYREAARLGLALDGVEVEACADFNGIGLAASNIRYRARVVSSATRAEIATLLRATDAVAEVHNTLRSGAEVSRLP